MKRIILTLIYTIICQSIIYANNTNFSQISSNNGLSQNTVRTVVEDKNGFIWAGTLDGLNRYDGYNIRSYQPKTGNKSTLNDHRIRGLYVSDKGHLWVKNFRNEFCCYDPIIDTFIQINDESGKLLTYTNFYESSCGDIWLWGITDGAICLKEKENNIFDKKLYSIPADSCRFLIEDDANNIWIGGKHGLMKVTKEGANENFYNNEYSFTNAIEIEGRIFFSTLESSLFIYNMQQDSFNEVIPSFDDALINLFRLSANELLILSEEQGAWEYDISKNRFRRSELNYDIHFAKGNIKFIIDKKKGVWFYDQLGMLWYCNGEDSKIQKLHLLTEEITSSIKSANYSFAIDNILADSKGLFWIVTYGYGLHCYNPIDQKVTCYLNQSDQSGLPSNYLLCITEDRFGNIWIGSEYAGLIRLTKNSDYVCIIRPENNSIVGKTNNVRSIYEDSNGNIWVGLKNGNLYVYNSTLTESRCIAQYINPYTLVEDKQKRMWVGGRGRGIYLFDINTFRTIDYFTQIDNDPTSLKDNEIFHFIKDNKERIWIASFGGGVSMVEETEQGITFKNFLANKGNKSMFRYLFQDNKGIIWAGSSEGLFKFDPDKLLQNSEAYNYYSMNTNQPNSLSSNDIKTIYQDINGTIWIGTAGGGLNKYVEATKDIPEHFISFMMNEGMPDNYVVGILEYEDDLWLSSESGLSQFNKKDYSVVSYQFAQNLYGNIFNEAANLKRKDGTMLWGSLDGFMVFDPSKFKPDNHIAEVLITRLQINEIDWTDLAPSSTNKSITFTDNIQLNYKQNTLTIEFATQNLRNPEKNHYSYILENYDNGWSTPSHSNIATYKNLPPGEYIFKVKGANSYGIWNEELTTFAITITPPYWKSWIAYIIYFVVLLLLLYIAFRLILKFNRLNNAVEIERQLTNHKLRFFTNISHEFRTPLTLIQGAVENLNEQDNLPASVQKQINVLNRNSSNLRRLIDQLLEFRKIQNDILKLDLEEVNIIAFTEYIYAGFQELAAQKSINYNFVTSTESLNLFIDRKKIDKVLYNLLSNAFKYTPKGGNIELSIKEDKKNLKCIISVSDSGIGVPKDKQHLLFSRFSQIRFSETGMGVGLSLVKEFIDVHKGMVYFEENPNGGSIFNVELSTTEEIYAGENFIIAQSDNESTQNSYVIKQSVIEPDKITNVDNDIIANYRLLIIDDNDDIRNFLLDGFRKTLVVDSAADGKEGLHKAIETNPDIIICDVMMPEMDGFEVTRQLRKEFQTCHIPIVLLTSHSSIEHQLEGIDSGVDAYITKPFSLKYVQKRIMKLIEQRELLKKRFSKEFIIDENLINSTDTDKKFFNKVEKILDENYHNSSFTIENFTELSGLGRTTFFKKVKGITGFSPNELIKIKRLNESAILLNESDLTISEISYKVGFEDPFYFSRCFKSHFDCTPSNYRKGGAT